MSDREARPSSLADWRHALEVFSRAPYVGPRPQTSEDKGMLIGREDVLETIEQKIQDRRLLVLDGDSGSGKTSLLQNGLRDKLEEIGFEVFLCRVWPSMPDGSDVDGYLIAGMEAQPGNPSLPAVDPAVDASTDSAFFVSRLSEALDAEFDGGAVLVLDQFEELLRQHRNDARTLMTWIRDVVDTYHVRIILSLRSDTVHLLDPHLKGISAYRVDRQTVTSFTDDEYVEVIIDARGTDPRLPRVTVEADLTERIRAGWRAHPEPKLLGLQALLWSLYFQAREDAGIDPMQPGEDAEVSVDEQTLARVVGDAPDMFDAGLVASVTFALRHAEAATVAEAFDPYLLHGTKELVRRATPFLWSGGFKVPAVEPELVDQILEPELRLLGATREDEVGASPSGELVRTMLNSGDLLRFDTDESDVPDTAVSWRSDATAGPLLGRPAHSALVEECRRAAFAIEWLCATGIARRTVDRLLMLVHDGSGVALKEWASKNKPGVDYQVHRLTAARGERFSFGVVGPKEHIAWRLAEPYESHTVLPNLNWRDCRITGAFEQIVFLNCDFSGASFVACCFTGGTFVNCLLDDANFESCTFDGSPGTIARSRAHDVGKVRIAPSFEIEVEREMASAFAAYLPGVDAGTTRFFSDLAGTAAVPGPRPAGHVGELVEFEPAVGGLALVGGRISFLTLHGCGTAPGVASKGTAEFHYVAGGGLDIVEPLAASVTLHDCALRGVSVTRDQTEHVEWASDGAGRIEFTASDSFLVNVYFSGRLQGTAEFTESTLWGIVNASGQSEEGEPPPLILTISKCRHQFLVNVARVTYSVEDSNATDPPPYFSLRPGHVSVFTAQGDSDLGTQLEFMDYRRDPEVRERRQRRRWAASNDAGT